MGKNEKTSSGHGSTMFSRKWGGGLGVPSVL